MKKPNCHCLRLQQVFIGAVDSNTPCLPFLRNRSPDGATPIWNRRHPIAAYYSYIDPEGIKGWVGLVGLHYSGRFTHISGHRSATGHAQDRESSPANDRRSTAVPRHQLWCSLIYLGSYRLVVSMLVSSYGTRQYCRRQQTSLRWRCGIARWLNVNPVNAKLTSPTYVHQCIFLSSATSSFAIVTTPKTEVAFVFSLHESSNFSVIVLVHFATNVEIVSHNYHRLRGSASPVLTALSMGKGNFRHPKESTPLNRSPKYLSQVITSSTPTAMPKLGAYPSMGGFWARGWNITKIIFIYATFKELTYRSDTSTDFHARWLKRRGLAQGCAVFGNYSHCSQFRSQKNPKKTPILGRE